MSLEIKNLSKSYGKTQALCEVSLVLDHGVYGMLGPNGAGKSTLINLITDNVHRETGEILWNGRDILALGRNYRSVLGYMPQQQGYYEEFTARGFLIYMGQLKGMHRKEAISRADELLSVLNLSSHAKGRIGGFSGGMRQRLLLGQALMNDPELLILDEPTAGVDPQERIRIRNLISEIAENRIVLLATHIVSDVEAIAREIILMKDGKVVEHGAPSVLLGKITGKVFEIEISPEELHEIEKCFAVSNLRSTPGGLTARILVNEPKKRLGELRGFGELKAIEPNLEDLYLYYFSEKPGGNL